MKSTIIHQTKIRRSGRFSAARRLAIIGAALIGFFFISHTVAAGSVSEGIALSSVTANVGSTVSQLSRILTNVALIAGVGFVLAALFKFHQHKLNPQQVPISQAVTLLIIGVALMLFVTMLPTAKRAVFGKDAQIAHVGGSQMVTVIGAS